MKTKLSSSIIGIVLTLMGGIIINATPKYSPNQINMNNKAIDISLRVSGNKYTDKWSDFCTNNFTANGYGKCISYSNPAAGNSPIETEYINLIKKQEYNTRKLSRLKLSYKVVESVLHNSNSGTVSVKIVRTDKVQESNPNIPVDELTFLLKMIKQDGKWEADDIRATQHKTYTIPKSKENDK